ncbi:MAG: hypothetical protein DBY17_00625 [Oscillospiraceae bacterium]|nr:MAG: hypothetical protein DBY17_00625 [Oscillospiraceae bacterium]
MKRHSLSALAQEPLPLKSNFCAWLLQISRTAAEDACGKLSYSASKAAVSGVPGSFGGAVCEKGRQA